MSKEEVCLELIALYYKNKSLFASYCMGLTDLFKTYNKMLEVLKVEGNE